MVVPGGAPDREPGHRNRTRGGHDLFRKDFRSLFALVMQDEMAAFTLGKNRSRHFVRAALLPILLDGGNRDATRENASISDRVAGGGPKACCA